MCINVKSGNSLKNEWELQVMCDNEGYAALEKLQSKLHKKARLKKLIENADIISQKNPTI